MHRIGKENSLKYLYEHGQVGW